MRRLIRPVFDFVKNSESLILATDPDREGEAIAWHVLEVLREKGNLADKKISRVNNKKSQ